MPWLESIENHYAIRNVLRLHPDLVFWVIRAQGKGRLEWKDLNHAGDRIRPFHFEIHFGKEAERDAHYLACLERAARERKLVAADLFGFRDLFHPLASDASGRTFLHVGQFLTEPLDWDGLCRRWRELSGLQPASGNPDFVRFARMALSVPIVEPAAEAGLARFLELYEELLCGTTSGTRLFERVDRLNTDVLSREWPNDDWVAQAVSDEKFRLTPWYHEGALTDWMKEGMGIQRLPTTALALMPVDPPHLSLDPVEVMVKNRRIQHELVRHLRPWPETGATALGDYGVTVLTSATAGKSAGRARVELRERGEKLRAFVRQRFGVRSVVGIGRSLPAGSPLYASHREAVVALHLGVQLGKDVLFHDERWGSEGETPHVELFKAGTRLADAFRRLSAAELKVAADQWIRLLLLRYGERLEVVRSQLLASAFELVGAVQKQHALPAPQAERIAADLGGKIEEARSVPQALEAFKEGLGRLSFLSSQRLEGPKLVRIEATLHFLRENFADRQRLPSVAKRAGFSVPAFSRAFKQATGTSFLAWLRGVRIEHARTLLRTSPLTLEQVGQASGFQSQHHLIRAFKTVTGETPGSYRRLTRRA